METAAFFDLDRTLLTGASGPMFSTMLKHVGVLPDRSIPGEGLVFKLFDVIGETLPSMLATRQMARAAAGWDRSLVQEAGQLAAERLVDQVPGFAKAVIARHHDEGRPVVMATTSPFDLVAPWPRRSASTTSSPPGTASATGATTGRSTASSSGVRASWRRCGSGPVGTASTWPRATPTPTRSTTCPSSRPSASRRR